MSKTLTPEDIKAIGKEVLSVVENCLKNIKIIYKSIKQILKSRKFKNP